jgi:hypothetical protein
VTTMETTTKPIEVRLNRPHLEITCRIVFPDGAAIAVGVDAASIPGAQREMTAWLTEQGYEPAGRWSTEDDRQATRTFRHQGPSLGLPGPPPGTHARPRHPEVVPDPGPAPGTDRPQAPRIPRAAARRAGPERASSPQDSMAELRAWALANARRDEIIRAAAAAGISLHRIQQITGIARTTIMRILGSAPRPAARRPS